MELLVALARDLLPWRDDAAMRAKAVIAGVALAARGGDPVSVWLHETPLDLDFVFPYFTRSSVPF